VAKTKRPAKRQGPRVLFLDIETKPILAYVWSIWQQNVGLNQIKCDWSILSFAAKWQGDPPSKIIYKDLAKSKDIDNDKPLLTALWKLLDEADIVVAHNGVGFDKKKIYARFVTQGFQPPAPFKFVDTMLIAKGAFGFTSNKLEHLSDKLNKKFKKQKHEQFSGFELWKECLAGNKKAWAAMKKYNCYDVLSLEELYDTLVPWSDGVPNFSLYTDDTVDHICSCGSTDLMKRGFHLTTSGKFQRYQCRDCGSWSRDKVNLFSKEKKASLHMGTPR
jgi:hypothetical protein